MALEYLKDELKSVIRKQNDKYIIEVIRLNRGAICEMVDESFLVEWKKRLDTNPEMPKSIKEINFYKVKLNPTYYYDKILIKPELEKIDLANFKIKGQIRLTKEGKKELEERRKMLNL